MKSMKKLLALTLVLVMLTGLAITASAATIVVEAGTPAGDGTESQDVLSGETYSAYKILNFTSDTTVTPAAYSYYLTTAQYDADNADGLGKLLESAGFKFTPSADGTQYVLNNADEITDAAAVANTLYGIKDKISAVAIASASKTAAEDKEVVFSGLETGYWFVTSSLGALCSLQSYDDEALIVEKNQMLPPPDKTVDESSITAQVGDTLNYTITLTDVAGTNLAATIKDKMSIGLDYPGANATTLVATLADSTSPVTLVKDTDYTESVTAATASDGPIITWTISAAFMTRMQPGDTIEVSYSATVNDKLAVNGKVVNTPILNYSTQELEGEPVEVPTTYMEVDKVDGEGTTRLKGAQFMLYRTDTALELDHVAVNLTEITDREDLATILGKYDLEKKDETVYYIVDPDASSNLIDMAQKDTSGEYLYSAAVVIGLDKASTYFLKETKAPEGYNLLDTEKEVSLADENLVKVENNAGTVLPSTGGIGTTLFYVFGSILVLGAGIVLVTKRRVRE